MSEIAEEKEQKSLLCSELCEYCTYIEDSDFICDIINDVTIVDWKPFLCKCPEKRRC